MSIECVSLTENMINSFKTTISSARTMSISLRSELKNLMDNTYEMLSSYETHAASLETQSDTIDILKEEIATMQIDNQNQLERKQAQITTIKEKIDVLNKELADVRKGVDKYDIQQQKNLIDQAELNLIRTKEQKDDYQIIADFNGRVRTVDINEGEQYKIDDKKYIVVENPNLIELKLQVSQVDIVKIKEGQTVTVIFDAYPYSPIQATITSRNVNPQINAR